MLSDVFDTVVLEKCSQIFCFVEDGVSTWKEVTILWALKNNIFTLAVFSLTLARSPMASRSYRRASDFLNYLPGLASDILVEQKSRKFFFTRFF